MMLYSKGKEVQNLLNVSQAIIFQDKYAKVFR